MIYVLTEEAGLAEVHIHALQTSVAVPRCHPLTAVTGNDHIEQVTITGNEHVHLWKEQDVKLQPLNRQKKVTMVLKMQMKANKQKTVISIFGSTYFRHKHNDNDLLMYIPSLISGL